MIYRSNEQLVKEIKKFLMDQDLTQRDIAERLGITPQAVQNLLNKKNLCFSDLKKILACAGYELEYDFREKE